MPSFQGGPLDGQLGYSEEAGDPPAADLAAQLIGPGSDEPQEAPEDSASSKFDRIIADARSLAASDGEFSEEDKLILEQVTTLLQRLKAKGEKDVNAAISGKMSPAVGRAYVNSAA